MEADWGVTACGDFLLTDGGLQFKFWRNLCGDNFSKGLCESQAPQVPAPQADPGCYCANLILTKKFGDGHATVEI
jgi:hypothetical protein